LAVPTRPYEFLSEAYRMATMPDGVMALSSSL